MLKRLIVVAAVFVVLGAPKAEAFCWDHTDRLIVELKELDLNTEQLKDIFKYQTDHRNLISQAHKDGRGCRFHENAEVNFEKASIGVLTDEQFKKLKGRERNETESLRFDNYVLKKEIARLKKEIEALRAKLAAASAGK